MHHRRLTKKKIEFKGVTEKDGMMHMHSCIMHKYRHECHTVYIELVALLLQAEENTSYPTRYDLVANICHDGKPNTGTYK